ncbi:MAG: cytidylyltransferase domain-containing protein [Nocardioidaceae bacterium]
MRPRTVAVVQARVESMRLPRKVLLDLTELTVLDWVVGRARRAKTIDQLVVATTTDASDDPLVEHCRDLGYPFVRGSREDVLDRVVTAAASERADVVVRLTGHTPFVDPDIVDLLVRTHLREHRDYTTNSLPSPHPHTYPAGLDVEVVSMIALTQAWTAREGVRHREGVTPYLYEEPGRFNVRIVDGPVAAGDARWDVTTVADLAALRALAAAAGARLSTPWTELLRVWRDRPDIAELNVTTERSLLAPADRPVRLAGLPGS